MASSIRSSIALPTIRVPNRRAGHDQMTPAPTWTPRSSTSARLFAPMSTKKSLKSRCALSSCGWVSVWPLAVAKIPSATTPCRPTTCATCPIMKRRSGDDAAQALRGIEQQEALLRDVADDEADLVHMRLDEQFRPAPADAADDIADGVFVPLGHPLAPPLPQPDAHRLLLPRRAGNRQ